MAGLVPAIHVVQLASGPNAWLTGRRQYRRPRCGWTTWMAGTSPAMTLGRQMSRRLFHPRGPAAGRYELAMTERTVASFDGPSASFCGRRTCEVGLVLTLRRVILLGPADRRQS